MYQQIDRRAPPYSSSKTPQKSLKRTALAVIGASNRRTREMSFVYLVIMYCFCRSADCFLRFTLYSCSNVLPPATLLCEYSCVFVSPRSFRSFVSNDVASEFSGDSFARRLARFHGFPYLFTRFRLFCSRELLFFNFGQNVISLLSTHALTDAIVLINAVVVMMC